MKEDEKIKCFSFYDPAAGMTFCVSEEGRHSDCIAFEPVQEKNGRPCSHFRIDIFGKCDATIANFEAWKKAKK